VRRACVAVLGAATTVAALGLSGCGDDMPHPAAVETTPAPITKPPTAAAPSPDAAPLPAPTALTDVMYKLADPNVPGADKVGLVQYATANDAAALDNFAKAMADGGYAGSTFEAWDLAWAQSHEGNVIATIVAKPADPKAGGDFTFPMEFNPTHGSWQLTRQTADLLLQLGQEPTATSTR